LKRRNAVLDGLDRSPTSQALENLSQALRVLDLAEDGAETLCPDPLIVVRAEIENARRYLALEEGVDTLN